MSYSSPSDTLQIDSLIVALNNANERLKDCINCKEERKNAKRMLFSAKMAIESLQKEVDLKSRQATISEADYVDTHEELLTALKRLEITVKLNRILIGIAVVEGVVILLLVR